MFAILFRGAGRRRCNKDFSVEARERPFEPCLAASSARVARYWLVDVLCSKITSRFAKNATSVMPNTSTSANHKGDSAQFAALAA